MVEARFACSHALMAHDGVEPMRVTASPTVTPGISVTSPAASTATLVGDRATYPPLYPTCWPAATSRTCSTRVFHASAGCSLKVAGSLPTALRLEVRGRQ